MRKKVVAGNWKMNTTLADASSLAEEITNQFAAKKVEDVTLIVCPPFINMQAVEGKIASSSIQLGAQNCYVKDSGAYTGETSVLMLKALNVDYVILGHSERREYFQESNEDLKAKVDQVLSHGLTPIFCCGETLAQREAGIHFDFVNSQLTESLFHLSADDFKKIIIAYEPIWAIGTGVTASSEQAQEIHATIRKHIASKYGEDIANEISILYGGSCKPNNAKELFACPDVDGGLIGGASLKAEDFVSIADSF